MNLSLEHFWRTFQIVYHAYKLSNMTRIRFNRMSFIKYIAVPKDSWGILDNVNMTK